MGVILFSRTILHNPPQLSRFKLLSDNLSDDSETDSHVQSLLSEAINMILYCQNEYGYHGHYYSSYYFSSVKLCNEL